MSNESVEIFGRHTSYNVQKVLWLADELGVDYRHVQLGGRFGGNDTAEFLSMNPMGKVPVLKRGDKIVWESNTILRYLADSFSDGGWLASEPYARSLCDRWLDWSIDRLEVDFVAVFWGYYRTPVAERDHDAIGKGVIDCQQSLTVLGSELGDRQFLLGDSPTIADVATGVFLHRLYAIDLEIAIPDNVKNWYLRLVDRPAYGRWVMSDFNELKGRASY